MSDSSRPTSPTSGAPQRHVSGSLRDRIAKFENLGSGGNAPAPRPMGSAGSSQQAYARGGLVGNRIPSLDPKSASYVSGAPRRVSERRDLIGNRVPSTGNANAAAALAARSTGGSTGSSAKASSPTSATGAETSRSSSPSAATASTSALGLGRPGQPSQPTPAAKPDTKVERAESPTGSATGSARDSTAGSPSVSSSAVSGHDSGSAPTSRTSSPATSPGPIPPQLLVSTLPEPSESGTMTPSSTRAEAGDQTSEMSMPATPVAINPELPAPQYDLVPGNLTLAAGPQLTSPKPPPSVSSSLVSQYDPKSEGDESTNLKDVSGVSTPTGTPRQAHKLLDDEVSVAGSATGSGGASSTRGPVDDIEAKVEGLALDNTDDQAPKTPVRAPSEDDASTPAKLGLTGAADVVAMSDALRTPVSAGAADKGHESEGGAATPKSEVHDTASETLSPSALAAAPAVATAVGAAAAVPAIAKADEKEPEAKTGTVPEVDTSQKAGVATGGELSEVTPTAAAPRDAVKAEESAPAKPREESKEATSPTTAKEVVPESKPPTSELDTSEPATTSAKAIEPQAAPLEKDDMDTPATETSTPAVTSSASKEAAPTEAPETAVETLADDAESTNDPPKSDAASDVGTIVPTLDSSSGTTGDEADVGSAGRAAPPASVQPSTPAKKGTAHDEDEPLPSPVARAGHMPATRDRDVTPVASELGHLSLDNEQIDREATPVPEPAPEPIDPSQPPPALDDDSDIVSIVGGAPSERGDDLHSNRSSMPPARASSELEFTYEELHERFFRDSQAQPGSPSVSHDTAAPAAGMGQGVRDANGQGAGQGAPAPTQGSRQVDGAAGLGIAGEDNVTGNSFPAVPATDVGNRRPVQVHVEPSPHGVLSDQPSVTVQAPSPSAASFKHDGSNGVSGRTSEDTSRVPTPVPPAFPDPPANDISTPGTPRTPGSGGRSGGIAHPVTPDGVSASILHSFPPVPDEQHPYVEVHVSPERASGHPSGANRSSHAAGTPFPRSASDRSGLGLARGSSQSFHPAPQRTSSLRLPITPPSAFNQQLATPPLGATLSPSGSYESVVDQPPGAAPPRRKRNSFTPRSPLLDDEDPGDFEPGEGWVTVNAFEPWRSPSKSG